MDKSKKDKEPVDADGEEVEASEPPEVALAREEVNLLLAEQQKTAALKVRKKDAVLSHGNGAYLSQATLLEYLDPETSPRAETKLRW